MTTFAEFVEAKPSKDEAKALIQKYSEMMCEALILDFKGVNNSKTDDYKFYIESGRKYNKIIMETGAGSRSVHAFIDKNTGEVYKPASWKAPAKIIRFRLLDEASRELMFSRIDWSGSYLYVR